MKNILSVTAFAVFLISCGGSKVLFDQKGVVAAIEKGSCFGKCPVYKMEIFRDGKVVYEGKRHTKKLGVYSKTITQKELAAISKEFKAAGFDTLPNSYESLVADLPSTMLYFGNGAKGKTVIGKENRPQKVLKIQYALERIADSDGWLMVQASEPTDLIEERTKETEVTIFDEIIIEPLMGALPRFLNDYQNKSVSLLDRVTEDGRLWLIKFNKESIEPQKMLELIKADERIKSAEFNKKLQPR
jgi:hypothetical protein